MDVVNSLAAVFSGVDDGAIALGQSLAASNLRGHPVQMADQGAVLAGGMGNRGGVLARNNQHVYRRLRIDVGKSVALIVLIDGLGRDASFDDPAKETTHG